MPKVLYTPAETAELLGVKVQTLAVWRCHKKINLRYRKIGRKVMYHIDDITSYIDSV